MVTAIIVAAGMGSRMNLSYNKQYVKLLDKEILAYTLEVFENTIGIDDIILVSAPDEIEFCRENIINKYHINKVKTIVSGGGSRQESVYNGLRAISRTDIVVVHDGARPFVSTKIIEESIYAAKEYGAAAASVKVKDTIKEGKSTTYGNTLNRENLFSIQTPQSFQYELILRAHENAIKYGFCATDDTSLLDSIGESVHIINGDYFNIKITTREDIYIAEGILKALKEDII
ncbi:MAG: 2-C-methyl-D-erythritol 4-phosphate cytidylyltransferase [Clostridium sp.]